MKDTKPKFITIEGMEGAGKSTNIKFICDFLSSNSIDFISTREPGGTLVSEKIRDLRSRSILRRSLQWQSYY